MVKANQARSAGAGARALYLGHRDKKRVSCTDEALVVHNDRAQTLRYPLARVARVVSSTVVDWTGDALAQCMRRGIGISWLDAKGQALGTCYPRVRQNQGLATALELWLESPGGIDQYTQWLRARRMNVLINWAKTQPYQAAPALWETLKREWVYGGRINAHLPEALHGRLAAFVDSQLAEHGTPPLLWGAETQPVNLDDGLCSLLWAEMNLGTGSLADQASQDADLAALFERWATRNGAALILHLGSLHRTALKAMYE